MYALDFQYGDFANNQYHRLSDFGFIVCQFDAPSGTNILPGGSELTFNQTPINYGVMK